MYRTIPLITRTDGMAGRVKHAVVASEDRVPVYDWERGAVVDEVLLMSGAKLPAQVPLQLDHARGTNAMIGSGRSLRIEGQTVAAQLHFSSGDSESDRTWQLVSGGHLKTLSIGYSIQQAEILRPGETKTIFGRVFSAGATALRVVTNWILREISVTPFPADASAGIRSRSSHFPKGPVPMFSSRVVPSNPTAAKIVDALQPELQRNDMRLSELCRAGFTYQGIAPPENSFDLCRDGVSNPAISAAIGALFESQILRRFETAEDSTRGLRVELPVSNFLPRELLTNEGGTRLEPVPRGGEAHMPIRV